MNGWAGKRIRIDLTRSEISVEALPLSYLKKWIGGRGINSEVVYHETTSEIHPFDADNPICFGVGPLTGTFAPSSGRTVVSSRSPLTSGQTPRTDVHGHGDANMGGDWGPELKFAGYDQLVIKGRAAKPTYLWIDDDNIELRDASHLWGKDTLETTLKIMEELGDPEVKVLCIGPAGEKLVRFANIICSFKRACGRTGMGAVMGSKNLKAIAVRGTKPVELAKPKKFAELCHILRTKIASDPTYTIFAARGTLHLIDNANLRGSSSWKNHTTGYGPGLEEKLHSSIHAKRYLHGREGCFSCPISCGRYTMIKEGPFAGYHFGGPEMESVMALGPRLGILEWEPIMMMAHKCDLYGMDTISAGAVIAWAMDCYERGLITEEDTGGIPLNWGDTERVIEMLEMIGNRKGFGKLLGEGTIRAAQEVGKGTDKLVAHVRGLDTICSDPRIKTGFSLGFAMSSRGSDHLRHMPTFEIPAVVNAYPDLAREVLGEELYGKCMKNFPAELYKIEAKPKICTFTERVKCLTDLMGVCTFLSVHMWVVRTADLLEMFNAATGVEMAEDELIKCAERVLAIERAHWNRAGSGRQDDIHPDKFFDEAVSEGPWKGAVLDRSSWSWAQSEYYKYQGWDENGFVTPQTLKELGLEDIVKDLEEPRRIYQANLQIEE